jgi:hypothetical protein
MAGRKKKVVLTKEEELKKIIDSFKKEIKDKGGILPPTRFFNIGDSVIIGHLQNCKIVDFVNIDGVDKVGYVISYDNIPTENQRKFEPEYGLLRVYCWYDIFTNNNEETRFKQNKHTLNFFNTGLSYLIHIWLDNDIDMEPEYQRDYVWNEKDKEELISSIFDGVEIGRFVIKRREWKNVGDYGYEIVDGKQRLNAICEFFTGKFKWNGKYFHELNKQDINRFKQVGISVCELRENVTREELLDIFIRINSFGKIMSKEHLDKIKEMK